MCHRHRMMFFKAKEESDGGSGVDVGEILMAFRSRGREMVENALRRCDAVVDERLLRQVEKEGICEEKERELEALREEVEQLSLSAEKLQDELDEQLYKLSVVEKSKAVAMQGSKVDKIKSVLETLDEDLKRIEREFEVIGRLEASIGIQIRGVEDTNVVIVFSKILEDNPEKEYRVHIPSSCFSWTGSKKYVEKVVPSIPAFEKCIGEDKKFEDWKDFVPYIRSQLIEATRKSRFLKPSRRRKQQPKN